ncbi:MAG TPA: hypothetical protein VKX49_26855 [Bryobacteraceae bacterium]|nr:hypothetical protein [Bryobacteraceae bacterium]
MKAIVAAGLLLCALSTGSMADKPRVTRAMLEQVENGLDVKFTAIWPQDPVEVVGVPQSAYVSGYGVVFMSKLNLAPAAGITPFHPAIRPDEIKRTHDKKVQRVEQLKSAMRSILADAAASLDSVPADEQIALGVSLFYWNWENHDGLPNQIVMHAPKKVLLAAKTGGGQAAISSDEY